MSKRAPHHEEHPDETWLVPYADLLTLLLALFIVLFAMGKTDEKKMGEMGRSFHVAFGGGSVAVMPFDRMAPQIVPVDIPPGASNPDAPNNFTVVPTSVGSAQRQTQEALRETVQLLQLKEIIDQYIRTQGLAAQLETLSTDDGLRLRIKDSALFPSGEAYLRPESRKLAGDIAKMLVGLPQQIVVAGHTDNVPINTGQFPSNWELSGTRAVNFMRYLLSQENALKPQNFSAVGYGEYRPLRPNLTNEDRAKNRRVEVWIIRAQKQSNT